MNFGGVVVDDFKVVDGKNGVFLGAPSKPDPGSKFGYRTTARVTDRSLQERLDAAAAACGEVLYQIIRLLTDVTPEIALPLYVAVSTDTGCFVYANTTSQTHRIAAELMDCGIDAAGVNKVLFRTKSPTRLAMEARMVAAMELYDNGRVVVMSIPLSLCRELNASESDVEDLSSLAALVQGTDCGITLREQDPQRVKISVRTGKRVDASAVCRELGGGGHKGAAGAAVDGTMAEAKAAILAAYRKATGA